MMEKERLLTRLFTVEPLPEEDSKYGYEIRLDPSHDVFQGHFPGMPVLPGVCMLYIIKKCISLTLDRRVRFHSIKSCKFLSVVNPAEQQQLVLRFSFSATQKTEATLSAAGQAVLKLRAEIIDA